MAASSKSMAVREKEVFVARQLHFANALAGNEPKDRARAMKNLRKFLTGRSTFCFTHDDFMRIWKGLFYCMWMSDKPLVQEELSEEISQLVHCFMRVDTTLLFIQACFDTLMTEWFGIDYHRMDKFQMFVRRFLRQCLEFCKNEDWDDFAVVGLTNVFESTVLSPSKCNSECSDIGLTMHFVEVFMEELCKVSEGMLSNETLLKFLEPFTAFIATQNDNRLHRVICNKIFHDLIRQSRAGMDYEEKFEAWERAGFPGTSWQEMVYVGKNDDRPRVKIEHLDPRAGKVNVFLPHIEFDAGSVADLIRKYSIKPLSRRRFLLPIAQKFQDLAKGKYPLAMRISKTLRDSKKFKFSKKVYEDAVEKLMDFNEKLEARDKPLKKDGKRKRNAKSDNLKKTKKMKLKKNSYEREDENMNLGVSLNNKQDCEDENSSSDIENSGSKSCEESEALSKSKTQSKNVLKGRKKKKLPNNHMWTVSQISKPQNEERNVDQIPKENTEVENGLSSQNLTDEGNFKIDSTISFDEPLQEVQSSESNKVIKKEVESKELHTEMECSSIEIKNKDSIQKNESTELNEKIIETSSVSETQPSPENTYDGVQVAQDQEKNIVCKTVEYPLEKKEITTLRKSVRRRSSVVPEAIESMKEKEEINGFLVENSSTLESVKKTLKQSVKPKRKLSKIFSPIEIEWEEEEEEEKEEENKLPKKAKSPLEKQVSSTPVTGTGVTKRISTVPDCEIVVEQGIELRENTEYTLSSVTTRNKGNECCSSMLTEKEKITSQKINLRSLTRQKRASLHTTPKKVNIALQMNRSQDFTEYLKGVISSPTIQYDANKKPCKGVLKQTSLKSPINPFYKPPKGIGKNMKFLSSVPRI